MTKEQSGAEITASIKLIARSLDKLGNGDAATQMGAVENLAKEVKEGTERIASSIELLAEAIRGHDVF